MRTIPHDSQTTEELFWNSRPEDEAPFTVIESCHSVWLFDVANRRFRRIVKGLGRDLVVATDWRHYDHLVTDRHSDAFVVFLDRSGTRVLRARRHRGRDCDRCSNRPTPQRLRAGAARPLPPARPGQPTAIFGLETTTALPATGRGAPRAEPSAAAPLRRTRERARADY